MVQILGSLSSKVCSTSPPKSVRTEPSLRILDTNLPSSASALLLGYEDIKYWSINVRIRQDTVMLNIRIPQSNAKLCPDMFYNDFVVNSL